MDDKRKRARVQGGWAQPVNNNSQSRTATDSTPAVKPPHNGASFSKVTGYGFFCGCESTNQSAYKRGSTNQNACSDEKSTAEAPAAKSKHSFQFKPDAPPITTPPPEMTLTSGGRHILGVSPNGASRLAIHHDFIESSEQAWMYEQLHSEIPWQERHFFNETHDYVLQPRLMCWFGDTGYTYSGQTIAPHKFSPLLEMLRDRVQEKTGFEFNSLLANLYRDDKDGVDWHSDAEECLGPAPRIASLSLGATRTFELRQKPVDRDNDDFSLSQHVKVPLSAGMLIVMEDAVQLDWQHRVPKEYHHREPRINLTFRKIQPSGTSS